MYMSKKNSDLASIVKYIHKRQMILAKILIHLGYRADVYDNFIGGCLDELGRLKFPDSVEDG